MKPNKEYESLYKSSIQQARNVFRKNFTCKLSIAPDREEFEVAVIPRAAGPGEHWDNVQVCLEQLPATFLTAYLRKGEQRIMEITTRSGGIKELWDMVKPIIDLINTDDIGFDSCSERHTVKMIIPVKIAEELGLPDKKMFSGRDEMNEWAGINLPGDVLDKVKIVEVEQ